MGAGSCIIINVRRDKSPPTERKVNIMKGTEKQIAWAQEIAERVIKTWEALREERKDCKDEYDFATVRIDAIKHAEYAEDIIALFKDYKPNGDMQHDVMSLAAIYSINTGDTTAQRTILCK